MEPVISFILALWPLWFALAAAVAYRWVCGGSDTYEEPPATPNWDANLNAKWRD